MHDLSRCNPPPGQGAQTNRQHDGSLARYSAGKPALAWHFVNRSKFSRRYMVQIHKRASQIWRDNHQQQVVEA